MGVFLNLSEFPEIIPNANMKCIRDRSNRDRMETLKF